MLDLLKKFAEECSKPAKGMELDRHGRMCGVDRKRRWFFFRERDKSFRSRIMNTVRIGRGTVEWIKFKSKELCTGVRDVDVEEFPASHVLRVILVYRWWVRYFWWAFFVHSRNKRRVAEYLKKEVLSAGVRLEVV